MKKLQNVVVAIATGSLLLAGCSQSTPPPASTPSKPAASSSGPAIVSAEKNSFQDVTAHLDPGGAFYMYWSTEQVVGGLSQTVTDLKKMAAAIPDLKDEQADVARALDVASHLIKNGGIEEISGVGMSSIAREKGLYQSKLMVHHYKGSQSGFLWSIAGKAQHSLAGLDLLPASTAFAGFGDFDVAQLWSIIRRETEALGLPKVTEELRKFPADYESGTGLKFDDTLASLGGEYGLVITLNAEHMVQFPAPGGNTMEFPEPGIVLVVKVKNDLIYNRVEGMMKDNPSAAISSEGGVRMAVMPLPLPVPLTLRPTIAQSGDYLFLASNDALVKEMLAVKKGSNPGLKGTAEFKKLAANTPDKGNNFTYISPRLGETINQIQRSVMPPGSSEATAMANLFAGGKAMSLFSVSQNTDEGWLMTANGNQSPTVFFIGPAMVAPVGLLAAIAIPNFVKARETAQKNACIANLKQIDGAVQQWALENKKSGRSAVKLENLSDYLRGGQLPACPAGGIYSVTTVSDVPKCSHPGHKL